MLDYALLDALAAVIRHGSFERAARAERHGVGRVAARETAGGAGRQRARQARAAMRRDDVGALLCRHTERVQLLEAELGGRMPALPGQIASTWPTLRVAVNDDSVATWFIDAVGPFCTERETLLDLVIDEDYTASRIRDGSVQGAVTAQAEPIQGADRSGSAHPLSRGVLAGVLRALLRRGHHARCAAPRAVRDVQSEGRAAGAFHPARDARGSRSAAALDTARRGLPACVRNGIGMGMSGPDGRPPTGGGELVDMSRGRTIDIDLYWQSWRLSIGWLDDFSAALKARAALFLD